MRRIVGVLLGLGTLATPGCQDATGPNDGSIEVHVVTTGNFMDVDPNGYLLVINNLPGEPIPRNVVFPAVLRPGSHQVRLDDVAANCTVAGLNPRTVIVPASGGASAPIVVTFAVHCAPPGGAD